LSSHYPPLKCSEFKAVLKALGFSQRPKRSGTSHEDWVATIDGRFFKVTVDCPKAPFSPDLIASMAHQAGVTKKRIYDIHFGHEKPKSK
jgi:predicted RNA binding protein YcfA (HicA-like mRNA interferase family)